MASVTFAPKTPELKRAEHAFYGLDDFTSRVVPKTVFHEMQEEKDRQIRALQAEIKTLRGRVREEKR